MNCRWCGNETEFPCGPIGLELCPSCWLAIGADDFLVQAPDLETALEVKRDYDTNNRLHVDYFTEVELIEKDIHDTTTKPDQ